MRAHTCTLRFTSFHPKSEQRRRRQHQHQYLRRSEQITSTKAGFFENENETSSNDKNKLEEQNMRLLTKQRMIEDEIRNRKYDPIDNTYVSDEGSDFFRDPAQLKAVAIFCAFLASFLSLGNIGAALILPILYGKPLQTCLAGIVFGLYCPGIDG